MIVELTIKNFAIIEDLRIDFTKGLNILTGETGSGKSILIDAIGIILGSRSNRDMIQSGAEKAILEGVFFIEDISIIQPILQEYSIDMDHSQILVISREIFLNGPSLSKINGKNVTLNMLKDITVHLVDIFGQHEHQSLLNSSNHEGIVDSFGDEELIQIKEKVKNIYIELINEKKKLKELSIDSEERDREIDILKFQIEDIDDARLTKEDESKIDEEYNILSNVSTISNSLEKALSYINNDDFENPGAVDLINKSISLMSNVKNLDKKISSICTQLENINYEIQDFYYHGKHYLENIYVDNSRLDYLNERLNTINKLKKKYGKNIESILIFKDTAENRLEELLNLEKNIEKINSRISVLEKDFVFYGDKLSQKRKELASIVEEQIKTELIELDMIKVNFKINFQRNENFTISGLDKIEFLISTNLGEELKPLSKIVSGGEMSRIMLAFKSIVALFDNMPTMIFDEIDIGISGRTAQIVGEKINKISKKHQVICISHLPQIAALADSHFVINKIYYENKTRTTISKISNEDRVKEMARLLGGVDLTETTIKHAAEMIELSKKIKSKN